MPHIEIIWSKNALFGLQKCYEFLKQYDEKTANTMLEVISFKLDVLLEHPKIGKPRLEFGNYTRQLFIPFGANGYVVLYQIKNNKILILAIKHVLELNFDFKN